MPTRPASAPDIKKTFSWIPPIEMPPASAEPEEAPTARVEYPRRVRLRKNQTRTHATNARGKNNVRWTDAGRLSNSEPRLSPPPGRCRFEGRSVLLHRSSGGCAATKRRD